MGGTWGLGRAIYNFAVNRLPCCRQLGGLFKPYVGVVWVWILGRLGHHWVPSV